MACSSVHNENEIRQLPVYKNEHFEFIPGEVLEYKVEAGLLRVGSVRVSVAGGIDSTWGKNCVHITADASSRRGLAFISKIQHHWEGWIDTASGRTVRMYRSVVENSYHAEQDVRFLAEKNHISQQALHKEGKPTTIFAAKPDQMYDLINVIWQFRYTDFDRYKIGDTLRFLAFFDSQWLVFNVRYTGIKPCKTDGKKLDAHTLQLLGVHSQYLIGENPVEIFLEAGQARRPLKVKVASYLGALEVVLTNYQR